MKDIIAVLNLRSPDFPAILSKPNEASGFSRFWTIGDVNILNTPLLGLLCSIRCPGRVIVQTYDLARALRDAGVPVIGGFHSPMEKECLDFLLRGKQPVVVCPARSITNMSGTGTPDGQADSTCLLPGEPPLQGRGINRLVP